MVSDLTFNELYAATAGKGPSSIGRFNGLVAFIVVWLV
jgi:hypothetical protein